MGKFIYDLIQDLIHSQNFGLILIGFIFFVILLFFFIIYLNLLSKQKKKKKFKDNSENIISTLTHEEIENISKNSNNPEEIKQILKSENERLNSKQTKKEKKLKQTKKAKEEIKFEPTETLESKKSTYKKNGSKNSTKKATDLKVEKPKTTTKPTPKSETSINKTTTTKPAKTNLQKEVAATTLQNEKQQYLGKWKIYKNGDTYHAELTASNGGLLLRTAEYLSMSGIKNGIETIKKNVDLGSFRISSDKYGHYSFKLYSIANRLICVSEDYSSKTKCENGILSVKRFAKSAIVITAETEQA